MNIRERRAIHETAQHALHRADKHRNIPLTYAAICCGMALIATVANSLLGNRISGSGGLGNIGLRSILSTGQSILPLVNLILTVCLTMGYHTAILSITRGFEATPRTLMCGFRHFGPVLRALILQAVTYLATALAAMYISSTIFMLTSWADPFMEAMEPYLSTIAGSTLVVDETILAAASEHMMPMMWILAIVCVVLMVPLYYRFRMVNFCLADDPRLGAIFAIVKSRRMMRRNCFALFRLDLDLWWFYLGQLLVGLISYGNVLLFMAGVSFPWSDTVSNYLFYILSLIAQVVLYYFGMNRVYAVYAVAYDALQEELPKPELPVQE